MTEVYDILENVENHFKDEILVNAVTFGDIDEADLIKQTLFPLIHVSIGSMVYVGTTINITLNIVALDILDDSKEYDNTFKGNVGLIDLLNTQSAILNKFITSIKRGRLNMDEGIVLNNEPSLEYLSGVYGNNLHGWGTEIDITIPNVKVFGC